MAWVFYIFLLAWPAVEIAAFIQVAQWVGYLGAILGIILSGMAGMALLRRQGLSTATSAQAALNQGQLPVRALFDAAGLAVAGILLILPGYVTDLLALLLLLPPVRTLVYALLAGRLVAAATGQTPPGQGPPNQGPTVIEGEWEVVTIREDDRPPPDEPPRLN